MSVFNGIKENDVVRIKFKDLKELYSDLDSLHTLMDDVLSHNMRAFLHGGQFVVISPAQTDTQKKEEYLYIENHLDGSCMNAYESMVESIEVVTDVPTFKNNEMGILITRLDNQLLINGHPLKNIDEQRQHILQHRGNKDIKPNDGLTQFREFIESWLMDVAADEAMNEEQD